MSQKTIKSPKHCAKRGLDIEGLYKKLAYVFSTLFLLFGSLIFLTWLVLRPSKPQFYLKETNIYQLDLSRPSLLNTSIQVTFMSKNPNQKVGVYYDQLQAIACYKGQQITSDFLLPPFYQGHEDTTILTALLAGSSVPVDPSFGYEVIRDQTAGKMNLSLKLNGKLKWKVGTWVSSHYHVNVNCVALVAFGPNSQPSSLSARQGSQCSTTV